MKVKGKTSSAAIALALMGMLAVFVPSAFAKKPDKTQPATVVSHVSLEGPAATQMYLQVQGDKRYLYIDQGANQGYTVVDVTKATQPNVVKHESSGTLRAVGPNLALSEVPDSKTVAHSHPPTESVTVMDTSDPANPKTVQTFKNVSSVLQDNGHGLVFLANDEGLWILRSVAATMRPARHKQPCGSESAISAMPPDCE